MRRRRHPHARARAGRRAGGRAGRRRSSPTSTRARRAGLPAVLDGRAPAAHGGRPRALARRRPRSCAGGLRAAGATELNETRRAARPAAARPRPRRDLATRCASSATFPQLEYPRAWPRRARTSSGRCCGSCPASRRRAAAGRRPARARRAVDVAGPRAPDAARGARGAGRRAGPRDRDVEPPRRPTRRSTCPANARARRLAVLREDDAALRRRRLPRAATARSCARSQSGCAVVAVPGGRRHERERRAGRLGGRRRAAAAAARRRRARVRLAVGRALGDAGAAGAARASWRTGRARWTRRRWRPGSSRTSRGGTAETVPPRACARWVAARSAPRRAPRRPSAARSP